MKVSAYPLATTKSPLLAAFKEGYILRIFLSSASDCRELCEYISGVINNEINHTLEKHNIVIRPVTYEHWPPSIRKGGAKQSSLAEVEDSGILIAFFYKKHGEITAEEVERAVELYNQQKIYEVSLYFRSVPLLSRWGIHEEITKIKGLRDKYKNLLTYREFNNKEDLLLPILQTIMDISLQFGRIHLPHTEVLESGGVDR